MIAAVACIIKVQAPCSSVSFLKILDFVFVSVYFPDTQKPPEEFVSVYESLDKFLSMVRQNPRPKTSKCVVGGDLNTTLYESTDSFRSHISLAMQVAGSWEFDFRLMLHPLDDANRCITDIAIQEPNTTFMQRRGKRCQRPDALNKAIAESKTNV